MVEMQSSFAAALLEPEAALPPAVAKGITPAAKRRFDIYRNNVTSSLIEALKASFPIVCRLVGDEFFKAAATLYIRQEPPRSPLLFRYGNGFADFLESFPPAGSVPYLGDVARLEWAWLQAYHAEDREPLPLQALAGVPQESLPAVRFTLHPSLTLLRSHWPLASLWTAVRERNDSPGLDMAQGEEVAVLRPGNDVSVQLLPPGGYDFITALSAGRTLGEAAALSGEAHSDFDLAHHLQGLFTLGTVVAIIAPDQG